LIGDNDLLFSAELRNDIDVMFLCVGHGEAKKFLEAHSVDKKVKVIDLSQDFRLHAHADFTGRHFIYGLPELNRDAIRKADNIANPGCFATAIQLGLLPLAKAGMLPGDIYTTGITGSTGAGQGLNATSHFSWRANNVQAYKTLTHQHLHEIHQSLHQLQSAFPARPSVDAHAALNFVPWRGDFTRGIFVSSTLNCEGDLEEMTTLFENYYREHPFTIVSRDAIFLKMVVNTNKTVVQLEKAGKTRLVVHSAIDNLLKGASGQAVQNMNIMFGLDERAGLQLKASYF
jgi:N-acetyl-gamma-glutamyl-phosphate reductase